MGTVFLFSLVAVIAIDYYWMGLLRILFFGSPLDKTIEGEIKFDSRISGVASNLKQRRLLFLKHQFYSGQHCRLVITNKYIYVGKAYFSYQLKIPTTDIMSVDRLPSTFLFNSLRVDVKSDNLLGFLKIFLFKYQVSEVYEILRKLRRIDQNTALVP
jgi:hypothetical protein